VLLYLRSPTIVQRLTEHDDVIKPLLKGGPRLGLALGPAPARASSVQYNVRCALSQTYPCIDKLLKNKEYQNSHWIWFNDNWHTFVKVHKHVRSYRRDLVSPYGLDSTCRVALVFVFYRPPRFIVWHFAILLSSYACIGHGPPKILLWTPVDPWTPGWEPLPYGESLSGRESNTEPSHWEADTLLLS